MERQRHVHLPRHVKNFAPVTDAMLRNQDPWITGSYDPDLNLKCSAYRDLSMANYYFAESSGKKWNVPGADRKSKWSGPCIA